MASKFSRAITSDIFELTAQGDLRFLVHKDILISKSQPLQHATSGVWREATEQKINLEDWDGDTVSRLVEFLYTGNYSYPDPLLKPATQPEPAESAGGPNLQSPTNPPNTARPGDPADNEPLLDPDRPLTPLDRYLRRTLPDDYHRPDAECLERFEPAQYDYKEALLSHAKVYALAHYKSVNSLQTLAFNRLVITLSRINPIQPDSHISSNIIDLVNYVYSHTDALASSEEPLRGLISQFAALNFIVLQPKEEMVELINEGGDFVKDLMSKVWRRLKASEKRLHYDQFISDIRLTPNRDNRPPQNCIKEIGESGSSNHNSGHYGRYEWLVPEFTTDAKSACTGFQILIQNYEDRNKMAYLRGNDGTYRYIIPVKDSRVKEKITEVALLSRKERVRNIASVESGVFDVWKSVTVF